MTRARDLTSRSKPELRDINLNAICVLPERLRHQQHDRAKLKE
jgi:hypothetical protein